MKSLSSQEARSLDKRAQEYFGIPASCLMEVAGFSVAQSILNNRKLKSAVIFCGKGNNGGDGLVAARYLINDGLKLQVYLLTDADSLKEEPRRNYEILNKMGIDIKTICDLSDLDRSFLKECDVIVDAIFGIGLVKEVLGLEKAIIEYISNLNKFVVSVDVPSGLNADTGEVMGVCIRAKKTITFVAEKKGFYLREGPNVCGEVIIQDIGIPLRGKIA